MSFSIIMNTYLFYHHQQQVVKSIFISVNLISINTIRFHQKSKCDLRFLLQKKTKRKLVNDNFFICLFIFICTTNKMSFHFISHVHITQTNKENHIRHNYGSSFTKNMKEENVKRSNFGYAESINNYLCKKNK